MILAAGYGTRLRPLTETMPKPLLRVGAHPILVWNLMLLRRHNITHAIINVHHLGNQIVEALGDGSRFGMRLAYSHEPMILGTGGGIKQAEPYLKNGTFLVMNGDTLSDCDLTTLVDAHRRSGALATLAVRQDAQAEDWGAIMLDPDSRIVQIKGEPPLTNPPRPPLTAYMFAGIHVLEPAVLQAIPAGPGSIIDVYTELLRSGKCLTGYRMEGYWSDIGTPERYMAAQQDVAQGCLALAQSEQRPAEGAFKQSKR